jgi:hypothetical protein
MNNPNLFLVYIGETHIKPGDIHKARRISTRGVRVQVPETCTPANSPSLNLIITASRDRVIQIRYERTYATSPTFDAFLYELIDTCNDWVEPHCKTVFVMDTCPTHNNAQQLVDDWLQLQVDTKSGIKRELEVLHTSPYSPDLNLVEPINGLIKTRVSQLGFAMKDVYYSRPKIHGEGLTYVLDEFRAYVEESLNLTSLGRYIHLILLKVISVIYIFMYINGAMHTLRQRVTVVMQTKCIPSIMMTWFFLNEMVRFAIGLLMR